MEIQIIADKNLKMGTAHFLYCVTPKDRNKFIKGNINEKFNFLNQLQLNGNITPQQMVNILLSHKSPL
tara:strand:+ start:259 stop:462 length:204 start_codon:yes stop_codon:yes gene_type:complete